MTCIVPPGVGGHVNVKVVSPVDGGASAEILANQTTFLSYTPSLVESVDVNYGFHGTIIVAQGSNFGNFSTPTAFIGTRKCTQTTRLSFNAVRCVVPKGAGKNLPITVEVGGQSGTKKGAATYSYPPPQVWRTFPEGGSGKGGNLVTITGRNFGDAASLGSVTFGQIGDRQCIRTTIVSDTLVECVAPSGVGRNLHVSVWAGGQESVTPVRHVHVNGTHLTRLVDTSGRNVTTLEGTSNATTIVLLGDSNSTRSNSSATNSNSSTTDHNSNSTTNGTARLSRNTRLVVATATGPASDEALYSYPTPEITLIVPDSVSGKGGDRIEIQGSNFGESGLPIQSTIEQLPCVDVQVLSSTLIQCNTPAGKGDAKPVVVITGGQASAVYDWFEYDGPRIWHSSPHRVLKEEDETTVLTFTGIHLGLDEDGAHVQALTVGGYPCSQPRRTSATKWSCVIHEKGRMGKHAPLQIHLPNRHRTSPPNASVSFFDFKAEPEVVLNVPSYGGKVGGEEMSIEGIFGPEPPLEVSIQIGSTPCVDTQWISPTLVKCMSVPSGKGHHLVGVQINGAESTLSSKNTMNTEGALTYDYDPPIVEHVSPSSGPTKGGFIITITGQFDGVASVTVRGVPCPVHSSDATTVTCMLPAGLGAEAPLRVISMEGSQSPAVPFAFDAPIVVETGPKDLSPKMNDGRRLEVRALNLGTFGKENEKAEHIAVVLEDSPLKKEAEEAAVTANATSGSSANTTSNTTNTHATGVLDVLDVEEGQVTTTTTTTATATATATGEVCADVRWGKEPGTVTCVPSAGYGYRSMVVVVAGQTSPLSNMSYAPAIVAGIHPKSEDPGKEIQMTIVGSQFTSAPFEVMSVFIGKQKCRALNIHSDNKLTCNITVRPGGNKFVNVQIKNLKSDEPGITFTATPPTVDSVEPNTCKLKGGCLLTLTGAHYFMDIPTTVSLSSLACTDVKVLSMNTLTCIAPRGISGAKIVVVDVGGARNDDEESVAAQETSVLFSYPAAEVNKVRPTHGSKR